MKRIAVLFYGQPRFFDLTKERFLEEYSFTNTTVDFFIHFWDQIGFIPDCDREVCYTINHNLEKDIQTIQPKDYKVTTYRELDELTSLLKNTLTFLSNGKVNNKKYPPKTRYNFGQHLSLKKAFNLMENYENKNNIKYDLVIKARPDFIFKDKTCYNTEEKYNIDKRQYYGLDEKQNISNFVYVCALAKQQFNKEENKWRNYSIKKYSPTEKILRDKYNTLRCGDVGMSASRIAADFLFNRWFDNYIITYLKDIKLNNPKELLLHRRHDSLQGENILNNNITAIKIKKSRLNRITNTDLMKEKWKNHNLIEINLKNKMLKEEIKHQLYNYYKHEIK